MNYSIAILGAGPGGYVAAIRAAQLGAKVCVVEKDNLGGTCLHRGCIPTKTILASIEVLEKARRAAQFGIRAENVGADLPSIIKRKNEVTRRFQGGIEFVFKKRGIDLVKGAGRITRPQELLVEQDGGEKVLVQAEKIIVATGSSPLLLPFLNYDGQDVITSTEALDLKEIPPAILVIGGSVVGCEFATIFSALGSAVTMVEMLPQILPLEDEEMVKRLAVFLKRRKIAIKTSSKIIEVKKEHGHVTARLENGEIITADKALIAIGRTLNTDGIGLQNVGITPAKGVIPVDEYLQTAAQNIFAIGDITGKMLLAHLASHQGIIAAENALGKTRAIDYTVVPRCTFTFPELASVGLTEAQARQQGMEVRVGKFPFAANGKALAMGETDGFVKVITGQDGHIAGAHILGPHASDLIMEFALAMKVKAKIQDVMETIHVHPTLAEAIGEAAEDVFGMGIHTVK